jgi:hypothetical protein
MMLSSEYLRAIAEILDHMMCARGRLIEVYIIVVALIHRDAGNIG